MNQIKRKKKEVLEDIMKKNLLRAALELLLKGGWEGITMKEVASIAGVSKGTIYNYFQDKKDLMSQLMEDLAKPYLNTFQGIVDSDLGASEKIDKMVDYALWDLFEHKKLIRAIMEVHLKIHGDRKIEEMRDPDMVPIQIQNMISRVLEEGIRNGEFERIRPKETAIFIQGGLMSAMHWCTLFGGEDLEFEKLQRAFKDLIFKGLGKRSDL